MPRASRKVYTNSLKFHRNSLDSILLDTNISEFERMQAVTVKRNVKQKADSLTRQLPTLGVLRNGKKHFSPAPGGKILSVRVTKHFYMLFPMECSTFPVDRCYGSIGRKLRSPACGRTVLVLTTTFTTRVRKLALSRLLSRWFYQIWIYCL